MRISSPAALIIALVLFGSAPAIAADADPARNAFVPANDPLGESATKVVYLSQNWSPEESLKFYFTAQGSQIIPYDWFRALEQADSTTPFLDHQNFMKYRYLPQNSCPENPDGLPVGFVSDQRVGRAWLGMTCAACHITEIHFGGTAYRVDGAPTHGDVQGLLTALVCAMQQTLNDPAKFGRFAAKVLGQANTSQNQAELKAQMVAQIKIRVSYNLRNFAGYDPRQASPPPPSRYGRLDAVDAIVNEVYFHAQPAAAQAASPIAGAKLANAPVSYPFLWDTPQHDFVEWLGIAKNGGVLDVFTLSRNVGEVLGVFGDFVIPETPRLLRLGYSSSVRIVNLTILENLLKTLWSPQWPADFPAIDKAAAAQGAALYQTHCVSCHALIDRSDPGRKVTAVIGDSGTDAQAWSNFFRRTGPAGKLSGVNVNFIPFTAKIPPVADADMMLSHVITGVIIGNFKEAPPDELSELHFRGPRPRNVALATVQPAAKYKTRPLNGIWATAPYLHNGSVPNLDALLRPAAQRPKSFAIGVRSFDPVKVGYLTDAPGFPRFNVNNPDGTPIVGNSNAGHEFGAGLSDEERRQLVEYLKTL
jgi:cytochrome c peroxidase